MAGAYTGSSKDDTPSLRIDANTTTSYFAGVGSLEKNATGTVWATAIPITAWHLITAGHAVDADHDGVIDIAPANLRFHLNVGGNSTSIMNISDIALHPDFTGFNNPTLNDDVAILTLSSPIPAGVPIYPILRRPMRQGDVLTLVGYGSSGWGNLGLNPTYGPTRLYIKRAGQNTADLAFLDDEDLLYPEVYVFDFDGSDSTTNSLGGLTLGDAIETTLGPGDSGGPAFIYENGQYQLAGIDTFIARFTASVAAPPLFGSAGGGVMTFPLGQWIAAQTGLSWNVNVLKLNVQGDPAYVRPGQTVVVDMDVLNLAQRVTGVQAFMNFSSTHFSTAANDVSVAAGGGVWDQLIYSFYNTAGDLDVAVGVELENTQGTQADGTTAIFTLKATGEGTTQLVFRPDVDPDPGLVGTTILSDELSQTLLPVKVNSQSIVIDGTAPVVQTLAAYQNGTQLTSTSTATQGTVEITVTATDNLAGISQPPTVSVAVAGNTAESATYTGESPTGEFHYTWTISAATPNGQAVVSVSGLSDRAGNTAATVTTEFNVNKNQLSGTVQFKTFSSASYGFTRDVAFVATNAQGAVLKEWTVAVVFANTPGTQTASGTFGPLLEAPVNGLARLSAKTNWHLRARQDIALSSDGQGTSSFTLLGGDINGSNSVNVLDYSLLKSAWGISPSGDINGDGITGTVDYAIMKSNWFKIGTAP
jgi:hypothetical protein